MDWFSYGSGSCSVAISYDEETEPDFDGRTHQIWFRCDETKLVQLASLSDCIKSDTIAIDQRPPLTFALYCTYADAKGWAGCNGELMVLQ